MFREIDTKDAGAVQSETSAIYLGLFPGAKTSFLEGVFRLVEDCFAGRHPGFQPIDTGYHNLEHTLQVTLCYARLLEGYRRAQAQPALTPRLFELAMAAMLFHDIGYLKEHGDNTGTGAKYTLVHVDRSAEFAARMLHALGLPPEEIRAVQNMIRCTGWNAQFESIPFQNELERTLGFGLATADFLGQMAAPDYIEKLGMLYREFDESNRFNGQAAGPGIFANPEDLRRRTPAFWRDYVLPRINIAFRGMHQYLARPFPGGRNAYLEKVEKNVSRLKMQLQIEAAAT